MAFEDVAKRMRARHAPYDNELYSDAPIPVATDEISYQLALGEHKDRSRRLIVTGIIMLGLGLAITIGTESMARESGGGTYIVAYGPMIAGIIYLLKGLLATPPRRP